MRSRAPLAMVIALAGGCEDDAREAFDLDGIVEPLSACVSVTHEALELGGPIHAYVGDGPGRSGGWGLVSLSGELALVRVPDSQLEAATAPILLGLPTGFADAHELRAGASPGELWVLSHAGSETLRRVLPELGEVARNDSLANFPIEMELACGNEPIRMLLLIEGRPYVLALPSCADDSTLILELLELERDSLQFMTSWQLVFDPCTYEPDPSACALENAYVLWSVGAGQATAFADLERVHIGFTQVRALSSEPALIGTEYRSDVSMLDLRMLDDGPQVRLITFPEVWSNNLPTSLSRVELGQDPFSIQLYVRNELSALEGALLRLDTIANEYVQITGNPGQLPLGGRGQLVQLANQTVMLGVEHGALLGVRLLDVDAWPIWTTVVLLEREDLVGFEAAGIGQFLLRFNQAPPQLLHIPLTEGCSL